MPIPSSNRLWVTSPTAEKFAFEFEIFRLTLVPLGEGTLTVTKQPQRLKLRVREMSCFRDSTLIISTALTNGGCATPFDLRGASDAQLVFLSWVSTVHAVVGHVHFTSGAESFLRRFQEGGIKGSCCSDPRVHTITKLSREIR